MAYWLQKRRLVCLIFAVYLLTNSAGAQEMKYALSNAHAHNDYIHPIPFFTAYHAGFGSIETDIFLKNNQLYVAHDSTDILPARTLQALYLNPLTAAIKKNKGRVYNDSTKNLLLLIDLKTTAEPTLNKLLLVLKNYKTLINCPTLKIVITGNRPDISSLTSYPSYIYFDGNLANNYTARTLEKIALFSEKFTAFTKWNGKGIPVAADRTMIESVVAKAHAQNKPIRFWAAPDLPNAWYQLMHLKVDYINTDKIEEISAFLNKLPANSYQSSNRLPVYKPAYKHDNNNGEVKNVILLIGDGMGLAHIYAAYTANYGALNVLNMRSMGMSKTDAADTYITDSGGGGTAMATGNKTNNRHIGVDSNGIALQQLPVAFKARKKSTAVITTGDVTDATPASFYAHNVERDSSFEIAGNFTSSAVDVLMGSGRKTFARTNDSLLNVMRNNGISIYSSVNDALSPGTKTLVLDEQAALTVTNGRGDFLARAMQQSLSLLSKNEAGFLLMAEGAKIDAGGHKNDMTTVVTELLDFDAAVGSAMQWADNHEGTLVIVTADHETGGLTLMDGSIEKGYVSGHFSTEDHTAIPVPVFAYGPQSGKFSGFYNNTQIYHKILEILK